MLYGIYLVSMEPQVAGEELRQLAFASAHKKILKRLQNERAT